MEVDTQSRMRARIAALSKRISHVDCQDACESERDSAGRRHLEGGTPSSSLAGHPAIHPEMARAGKNTATDKSGIALKPQAHSIENFGTSAGVLVRDGTHFVFHAAHRAFLELDQCCFKRVAHAERAIHQCWARFQHRGAAGVRFNDRSRSIFRFMDPRELP
jgi:hypothetical protein